MTPYITEPEFCPRPSCPYYDRKRAESSPHGRWYRRYGTFHTRARGTIQRFRCNSCGKTCSTQTFSLHYWTHSSEDYQLLLRSLTSCSGLRQHARFIDVSFRVVQNRIRHLARNCLAVLDAAAAGVKLSEDLVMDGFESFTRSQYFPNNITIITGSRSQYLYGAVHTLLRRKGRMSDVQRKHRARIDEGWRPQKGALRADCAMLLSDQAGMIEEAAASGRTVTLWSDEHREYPRALGMARPLAGVIDAHRLEHRTESSRAARTKRNPLFAVNYVDRQIRKNMGEHVRETVKQGREVNSQMERMAIFAVAHNYLSPHRVRDGVRLYGERTHAGVAGIEQTDWELGLTRLYTHRRIWGHSRMKMRWQRKVWQHEYENPPDVRWQNGRISEVEPAKRRKLPAHFAA